MAISSLYLKVRKDCKDLSLIETKPTTWHAHPAKTQISLGIRPVWSESSLSAWRSIASLSTYRSHSEDSDLTAWLRRLIWVLDERTCRCVGFVLRRFIWIDSFISTHFISFNVKIVFSSNQLLKHRFLCWHIDASLETIILLVFW